jgi:hypothetical protein
MINFDPYKLIRLLLPTFLRRPIRIARLWAWLASFARRWSEYLLWRTDMYYLARVTAQVISLEAYLNRLLDPAQRRITVEDMQYDNRLYVSLRDEPYDDLYIDGEDGTYIYLANMQVGDGFVINIPAALAHLVTQISGVANKIRALGTYYQINIIN